MNLPPEAQGTQKEKGYKVLKPEAQEVCCKILSPRYEREVKAMKSPQYSSWNKIWTKTISVDIPM